MSESRTPAYGRRLVPQVLDELATTNPERVYAAIPETTDVKNGYRDVTVADLARCVDFMARWIEEKFGRSNSFETLTYIGLSDLKGIAALLAAIKTGYKASPNEDELLVPSPRNPPPINVHLMRETSSNKVLHAEELAPLIKPLIDMDTSATFNAVPPFQVMLDSQSERYPYEKSFEEARNDPIVVLHSSGSTGIPKPIIITHGSIGAHDNDHNRAAPVGRKKMDSTVFTLDSKDRRLYLILPFFHLGGFLFFIDHAILNNLTLVLGPPHVAPDATLLKQVAQQQKLRAIMVVPSILEQLLHDPKGIDLLKSLEFVGCAGAPLPSAVGDRIKDVVRLCIFIGSTETFALPELAKSPDDWQYHEFNPNLKHEMRSYDIDTGTFELVILADETTRDSAPVYHNVPGENPFYTRDLFTKHPIKPNLYKYYGRRDDILVLANGEKVNPIPLEQYIQGSPGLKGVLLIGNGRSQTALLVEPTEALASDGHANFIEALWPRIQEANAHVAGPGRVARGMVICASSEKAFTRTAKATIVRKLTEETYQHDISRIYLNSWQQENHITVTLQDKLTTVYEPAVVIEFLRQIISASFPPASVLGEEEDFFAHGIDSIQTLEVVANLKRNLESLTSHGVGWISPKTVFRHPTLTELSRLLAAYLNHRIIPAEDLQSAQATAVEDAVARHIRDLPSRGASQPSAAAPVTTIAIVGSTGYVGTHLVAALLRNGAISHIYCLNRDSKASTTQKEMLSKHDSFQEELLGKLTFLGIKLGAPHLGLNEEEYEEISTKVDVVVYNSWRLDFGLTIRSFEAFLQATRDLVDLSVTSRHNMRIVFVSSVSSVLNLAATGSEVPEAPVEDSLAAMNNGYGQSKLAAERILVTAQRESKITVSIIRVGQVGGSSRHDSVWPDQPWISAIIRTSKALGCFPNPVAPVDWVSVDTLASIIESVILQPGKDLDDAQFFNVISKPQPWKLLLDVLHESWPTDRLEVVSLTDWVKRLRALPSSGVTDVVKLPALRLMDFYDVLGIGFDSLAYVTAHSEEVSGANLGPVRRDLLSSWLRSWDIR